MISVLGNWLYIAFTTFCLGYGFTKFTSKTLKYTIKRVENVIFIGLIIATVYAQIFSIFYKVGLVANVILVILCITCLIIYRKVILKDIAEYFSNLSIARKLIVVGLIFLWAYFSSKGYMHYDSDLYHAQSIRWIEEYGVVKGLGNLHNRLAYNSSIFAVTALFSMKFLVGQSLHTVCGFMALLLNVVLLDFVKCFKNKKLVMSDWVRIAAFYYLTLIYDEIVSPASDYIIMCTVFYLVLMWLEVEESKEKSIVPYALICVGCVYAVSLKLTAGLILILLIKPAYILIKQKKVKEILLYIFMGCIVILPWLVRNVIISGYLIYPYPQLDLFSFSWKIDPIIAIADAAEIKTWGRGLYNALAVELPIWEWFGNWFSATLSNTEKLIILADITCVIVAVITIIFILIKRKWQYLDWVLVETMAICCYLFWQTSAPLFRYGYAYTLLLIVTTFGFWSEKICCSKVIFYLVMSVCVLKLALWAKAVWNNYSGVDLVWQMNYTQYDVLEYEIEGETFYYPVSGDRIGYDHFPASTTEKNLQFIGEGIKSGFCVMK